MQSTLVPALSNATGDFSELLNNTNSSDFATASSNNNSSTTSLQGMSAVPFGFAIGTIGFCANFAVFAVLYRARRQFNSSVGMLIMNQSFMDLLACFFLVLSTVMMLARGVGYNESWGRFGDNVYCVLFEGAALTVTCMSAEKIGLVVITVERYFMIVHSVAHRKYYRKWMTSVSLALPWISGLCTTLFPAIGATKVVNGQCMRLAIWPTRAMLPAYRVFQFLWNYALQVLVFIYCYARIFHVIRRQSKVISGHEGRIQIAPAASTSRDQGTGQIQQQATGATTGAKLSRTEMNVLQTMLVVVVCFLLCWTVGSFAALLGSLGVARMTSGLFNIFAAMGYVNLCLNPFIYAARYEVFKRSLKQMLNKSSIGPTSIDPRTRTTSTK